MKYLRRDSTAFKAARNAIVSVTALAGAPLVGAQELKQILTAPDLGAKAAFNPDGSLYVQTARGGYNCGLSV